MDDDGSGGGDGVLVEEQVFDYSELPDSCEDHLRKTCYERYHAEVLDGGFANTDDDEEGEDDDITTAIIVDTKINL